MHSAAFRPLALCLTGVVLAALALARPAATDALTPVWSTDESAAAEAALRIARDPAGGSPFAGLPGGGMTAAPAEPRLAFATLAPTLDAAARADAMLGRALFDKTWVGAPSATPASDGLGPLFNARSCATCHVRGGRGTLPGADGAGGAGLVLRLGMPDPAGGPSRPDPVYGRQLQDRALAGQTPEGRLRFGDSGPQADFALGPPGEGTATSLRNAQPLVGLGLIAAIPEAAILALADPLDVDGDGVSGRAAWLPTATGPRLGRFGWKAGEPDLAHQTAQAFLSDMGLSTPLHPMPHGDCTKAQPGCLAAPTGEETGVRDGREVDARSLALIEAYLSALAVPPRQGPETPAMRAGAAQFHALGCASCHQPAFLTDPRPDRPATGVHLVWPYSDFLLHDMGPGLADGLAEGAASGSEWRTAPLWGLGRTGDAADGRRTGFLHDARAPDLDAAIRWHGGEAEASRAAYEALSDTSRADLIAFLNSL